MEAIVSALRVYPVKSCKGIAIERSAVEARGLRHDRRWMIVDDQGTFVTQRTQPRLTLVGVRLEKGALALDAPGMPTLRVPSGEPPGAPRRRVRVWHDDVDAADCGPEAAQWISDWLGSSAALVFMPDDVRRPVKPAYARPEDIVGFADAFPLLIASTSSLDDLNGHMDHPLPMDRFRPNIVVSGCGAWAEDDWKHIRVGDLTVRVAKPCERCVITTTDQETGERGVEPLRTLARFRRRGNDVLFAQNAVPDAAGSIAVGDEVTVLDPA